MPFPHCVVQSTGSNQAEHYRRIRAVWLKMIVVFSHTIQFNASFLLRINFCFTKRKTPENCVICCCCVRSLTIVISARVGPSKCAKSSRAAPARISATDGQLPFRRTMTSLRLYLWSRISLYFLSTKSESCTNGQRSTKSFDITWLPCSLCVCTHWDVPMSIRKFFFFFFNLKSSEKFSLHSIEGENWIPADDFSSPTISVAQNYYLAIYRTIEITTFYTYRHISTISCDLSGISEIGYFHFLRRALLPYGFSTMSSSCFDSLRNGTSTDPGAVIKSWKTEMRWAHAWARKFPKFHWHSPEPFSQARDES
jgi:hypothetical protein